MELRKVLDQLQAKKLSKSQRIKQPHDSEYFRNNWNYTLLHHSNYLWKKNNQMTHTSLSSADGKCRRGRTYRMPRQFYETPHKYPQSWDTNTAIADYKLTGEIKKQVLIWTVTSVAAWTVSAFSDKTDGVLIPVPRLVHSAVHFVRIHRGHLSLWHVHRDRLRSTFTIPSPIYEYHLKYAFTNEKKHSLMLNIKIWLRSDHGN